MRNRKQISDWVTGGSLSCSSNSSYGGESSTPLSNSAVSVVSVVSTISSASTNSSGGGGSGNAVAEPAFRNLSKSTAAFIVWRVQHMQVVAVPREQWGTFFDGDAYLILAAAERGQPAGQHVRSRNIRGGAEQHVHLWLGAAAAAASATAGVAAFKAAELDEALGGGAALHRELQGAESPRFISYFAATGIRVLRGGLSASLTPPPSPSESPTRPGSGSRQSSPSSGSLSPVQGLPPTRSLSASVPRVFRVTGRRCAILTELAVSWTVFSQAGVFVVLSAKPSGQNGQNGLSAEKATVVVWMGRYASEGLRLLAVHAALDLKEELSGCELLLVEEGQEEGDVSASASGQLRAAGLEPQRAASDVPRLQSPPPLASAASPMTPGAASPAERAAARCRLALYHCADKDDTCVVTEVKSGPLDHKDLQTTASYIVDQGCLGAWLWVGRQAAERERIEALRNVQGFVRKKGYPVGTPAARIIEGAEPTEFQCLFRSWRGYTGTRAPNGRVPLTARVDAEALEAAPRLAADARILDDGNGVLKMWRVAAGKVGEGGEEDETSALLVDAPHPARLYSAECFVLQYSYGRRHAVFYWMGKGAPVGRRSAAARLAAETASRLSPPPLLVRVVQGHEPPCLLAAFRGLLLVLQGPVPSAGEPSLSRWLLLRIDGNHQMRTRAVQIERRLAAATPSTVLRPENVLVLRSPSGWILWCGRASTGDQREAAKRLATSAGAVDTTVVLQGQEKDDFWSALSDKAGVQNGDDGTHLHENHGLSAAILEGDRTDGRPARLFYINCVSSGPGVMPTPPIVAVEEVLHFRQCDLLADEFMLLDAGDCVFAWVGVRAPRDSKRAAVALAVAYLASDPAERDVNSPVIVVQQGHEPPLFTGFFPEWDTAVSAAAAAAGPEYDSLESLRAQIEGRRVVTPVCSSDGEDDSAAREFRDFDKFPLQLLLDPDIAHLPDNVDVFRKELHLTHSDFVSVFRMTYPEFCRLPTWRKQSLKKSVGLF